MFFSMVYADILQNYKDFAESGREAQEETVEKLNELKTKYLKICELYEEEDALDEMKPSELEKCKEFAKELDS